MSGRFLEDFTLGEVIDSPEEYVMTPDAIHAFASEYDPQPIHLDPEGAAKEIFGGVIASGWHSAALYMGMFVRNVLLDSASLGSPGVEELRWLVPVRPGDVLTGRSRVVESWPSERDAGRGTIVGEHELVNQNGDVVMRMRARSFIARRPT